MAILCLPVLSAQASPTSDALVIGIQSSKTTSLNPLFPVERDMLSIFDLMYDSLITIDDNYQPQAGLAESCLLYTSPSPRDRQKSRMPSSA